MHSANMGSCSHMLVITHPRAMDKALGAQYFIAQEVKLKPHSDPQVPYPAQGVPGWAVTLQQSWGVCGRVSAREIEGFPRNTSTQGTAQ